MQFTGTQIRWLKWLHENGGAGMPQGLFVVAGEERSGTGAAISFLNLVVKGALEVKNHRLVITGYGRRLIGVDTP
jgi:hypothetical protein